MKPQSANKIKDIIRNEIRNMMMESGEGDMDAGFNAPVDDTPVGEPVAKKPTTSDMRYAATLGRYYEHLSHEITLMEAGMETFRRKLSVVDPNEIQSICSNIRTELSRLDDILNKTARA